MLGITYKSAWFMAHRLRHAMTQEPLASKLRGVVEADETYMGGKPHNRHASKRYPLPRKTPVVSLVERDGRVRSRVVADVSAVNLKASVRAHVQAGARLMTDGNAAYVGLDSDYRHEAVNHQAGEYVRGIAHTNTVEGYFALLKRGVYGVYHHVSAKHLPRYLGEFDHRWNARKITDGERAVLAVRGAEGKRLTYRPLVAQELGAAR
jgi:hypothetical protein